MINKVVISRFVEKRLSKLPKNVVWKLLQWIDDVEYRGLEKVKQIPSYHDEALRGERKGQRSIRLNKAYRAIYSVNKDVVEFILIEEVSKHEY